MSKKTARRNGKSWHRRLSAASITLVAVVSIVAVAIMASPTPSPEAPAPAAGNAAGVTEVAGEPNGARSQQHVTPNDAKTQERIALGDDPEAYEPGYMLALLADGFTADQACNALATLPGLDSITVSEVIDDLVRFELPNTIPVEDAVALAEQAEGIAFAQPNYRYRPFTQDTAASAMSTNASSLRSSSLGNDLGLQSTPNDPFFGNQWYVPSVKVDAAWKDLSSRQKTRTTIAVIDAGFLVDHEDLEGSVVAPYDATTKKAGIAADNIEVFQIDHGTHCAGIIAARAGNKTGIAGVTRNTCKVLPIRVQDSIGNMYTSYVAQAFSYLISKKSAYNIRVANISMGTATYTRANRMTDYILYDAIQKGRDAGIVTVAAACNEDEDTPLVPYGAFPADFDNVVSVIALSSTTSNADKVVRASYSNYNKPGQIAKNISAPGTTIVSLLSRTNTSKGTYYGTMYGNISGTSMAAPVVSGVMGLMFATDPKLSVNEAISKLYSSAKDLTKSSGTSSGWDRSTGFGKADAAAAIAKSQPYLSGDDAIRVGKKKTLSVKIAGKKQAATNWQWSSSDTAIATVNSKGVVKGKAGGRVIITATKGTLRAQQVLTVSIPAKSFRVTLSKTKYTYTGKAHGPTPRVSYNGQTLMAYRDYTVSYKNNVNAGKATVIIKGVVPYFSGSVKKTFTIKKAPLRKARVKLSAKQLKYTGKARKPVVTVYDIGKNKKVKLKKGADFKVSGHAVVKGKGTLTIKAKKKCGNFTGSVKRTFYVHCS